MKKKSSVESSGVDRIAVERGELEDGVMHTRNLFDENPDGKEVDEASGKPWDDTGGKGNDESVRVVSEDEMLKKEDENDAAEKWLRENDPSWGKK
jgi:hypothetical protein